MSSAAHASDPEFKKFKTIKVSMSPKIKLSTTEPVVAVAKSIGDFSVKAPNYLEAAVGIAAVFPSVASVSVDSRIVSTRLPVGTSSVVSSAAHASDPEFKKFKTIKVSISPKIKLSTMEPVAAVAESIVDFSESQSPLPYSVNNGGTFLPAKLPGVINNSSDTPDEMDDNY